jgi:hypothetical protein
VDVRHIADSVLQIPRLAHTLRAARRFEAQHATPAATDGSSQYAMRAAMDLDPRVGKAISRAVVPRRPPIAWQVADLSASRIVAADEVDRAVAGVRRDGYYVFERTLDRGLTDAIRAFAETAPCRGRGEGMDAAAYPRQSPTVGRYDFDEEVSLACPEVQEFVTDPGLALIAQRYLGQAVIMDEVAFWWTTTARAEDASLNAQLFHQDRDRLSFLKFFVYLTDVTTDTGPHVYVRGSHRRIPWSLRHDGRISDEHVRSAGLGGEITELTGPAGTLMAVDTIGLHKGKTPTGGDRLALENEFATSLFGMDYERPSFEPTDLTRDRYLRMPWVLQRYRDSVIA